MSKIGGNVSEITVGNKVRVVQVIMKEDGYRGFHDFRLDYLGKEGQVTRIVLGYHYPYRVAFLGRTTARFTAEELEVLDVPCEQQKPPVESPNYKVHPHVNDARHCVTGCEVTRLQKRVAKLRAGNECMHHTLKGQYELSERRGLLLAELQEKYDGLLQANASVRIKAVDILKGLRIWPEK